MKPILLLSVALGIIPLPAHAEPTWKRLYSPQAEASSFLANSWNKYQENYHPSYVLDDNPETAWVEGVDGYGEGESLAWTVSSLESARAVKLRIRNGYQKSQKLFEANSAPKEIELQLLDSAQAQVFKGKFTLEHKVGWQELAFQVPGGKGFSKLRLKILSVYPGSTYKDTCISDIETYVDTDVPYNEKAELAKKTELSQWIKQRVSDAKYFASLPAQYPFAGTSFKSKDQGLDAYWNVDASQPPFFEQLAAGKPEPRFAKVFTEAERHELVSLLARAKALSRAKGWYRAAVPAALRNVRTPDVSGDVEFFSKEALALLARHRSSDGISYFETKDATTSVRKAGPRDSDTYELESNFKVEKEGGMIRALYMWHKAVGHERGLWEVQNHYILVYGPDKRLDTVLEWRHAEDDLVDDQEEPKPKELLKRQVSEAEVFTPVALTLYKLRYDGAGKIAGIDVKRARSYHGRGNFYWRVSYEPAKS